MRNFILTAVTVFLFCSLSGQDINNEFPHYPDGIYETKSDFLLKKPNNEIVDDLRMEKIGLIGQSDSLVRRCKFYNKTTDKKIKKVFAIAYQSRLYLNTGAILKYKNKKDKGLSANSANEFVLVLFGGEHYLYAEAGLINHWKTGLSGGVASGVGGILGAALGEAVESTFPTTTVYGKGVVWDVKNEEFNVFTNCKDFNVFLQPYELDGLDCKAPEINLNEIRERIRKIM